MERPIFKPIGTPTEQLDTPTLVVDLDALAHNIETVHSFFRDREAKLRPHVEAHGCPGIAHRQLASAGTVGGVSVSTVGEAEVFAQAGITDITVANEVVTAQKIARLCALAQSCRVTVAVDNSRVVERTALAARDAGVVIGALVDVHTRLERCGVAPGEPAVALARQVHEADGLRFAGLMTYEGAILTEDSDERAAESRACVQRLLDTREMVERAGIGVETVSAGGTHNYDVVGDMAGVTEVPAGSYALLDYRYSFRRPELKQAARVLTTVMSRPEEDRAFLDCGQKAIGIDTGLPAVEDIDGAEIARMSAEHGFLMLEPEARDSVDLGDKVWLTPWEIGTTANIYDYVNGVRGGKLEVVWDVSARGRYR